MKLLFSFLLIVPMIGSSQVELKNLKIKPNLSVKNNNAFNSRSMNFETPSIETSDRVIREHIDGIYDFFQLGHANKRFAGGHLPEFIHYNNQHDFGQKSIDIITDMLSADMALTGKSYGRYNNLSELLGEAKIESKQVFSFYNSIIDESTLVISNLKELVRTDNQNIFYSEALFFRGLSLFYLANLFDFQIPLKISYNGNIVEYDSQQQILDASISDLVLSKILLSNASHVRESKRKINIDIVKSYLAYAYALNLDWENVVNITDQIIKSENYTIMTNAEVTYSSGVPQGGFNTVDNHPGIMWGVDITASQEVPALLTWWGI